MTLNKEFIDLFNREYNAYYQLEFLKGVFKINDLDLAVILLDLVPVNIVSGNLILYTLTEIVKAHYLALNSYKEKGSWLRASRNKIATDHQDQKPIQISNSPHQVEEPSAQK